MHDHSLEEIESIAKVLRALNTVGACHGFMGTLELWWGGDLMGTIEQVDVTDKSDGEWVYRPHHQKQEEKR